MYVLLYETDAMKRLLALKMLESDVKVCKYNSLCLLQTSTV